VDIHTQFAEGKAATVGSALSKHPRVKSDQSWRTPGSTASQMEHLDAVLPKFLSGYIRAPAENQPGKEVHKLLLKKSSKFLKIL